MTGATLRAESIDRPIAYRLRDEVGARLAAIADLRECADPAPESLVCSDLWWLNHPELQEQPTISVGAPESNALTAYLAGRLPQVFSIEQRLVVQADLHHQQLLACCWGRSGDATEQAVRAFADRHLDAFLAAALDRAD